MFPSYDMASFSTELKNLRKTLALTIDDVANCTGLGLTTIKSLEQGIRIPKFETLLILSTCYKVDLIAMFSKHKNSMQIFSYYEKLNKHMAKGDRLSLKNSLVELNHILESSDLKPVQINDYLQVKYFFEGLLIASETSDDNASQATKAIHTMIKAIQVTIPDFKLEYYMGYKYTSIEIKILFSIASLLGVERKCVLSNEILQKVVTYIEKNTYADYYDILLTSKAYALMAYNHHRLDQHDAVLKYASIGIAYCRDKDTTEYLPLLLARKSVALYHLNDSNWQLYYSQALNLLDVMGKEEMLHMYRSQFNKLLKTSQSDSDS